MLDFPKLVASICSKKLSFCREKYLVAADPSFTGNINNVNSNCKLKKGHLLLAIFSFLPRKKLTPTEYYLPHG